MANPLFISFHPAPRRLPPVSVPAALFCVLCLLLSGCNPGREYQAALVLADIAAGSSPSRLKKVSREPKLSAVTFPAGGHLVGGELYLSGAKPSAGVLLLPGAAEKGKDDPRLQAFARSLARGGFAVLVPDFQSFRSLKVNSGDIARTADAFAWLSGREELAPGGRAGIFSFSYASGPAIIASLDPRIAGRVRFIMAVGGYYDVKQVLTFFTTGYYLQDGRWRHSEPNSYGKWIFVLSNIERLSDPSDRKLFEEMARRKLKDTHAKVEELASRLTPEAGNLYAFVENRDPSLALPLLSRLPEKIRRDIRALDLAAYDLTRTRSRFILVHGYDDDIIPYTQSEALAQQLPAGAARLYLVNGLQHVDLEPGLIDTFRLWRAISALLREREATRPK